jgi:Metallo-beta-lactamase superfamily
MPEPIREVLPGVLHWTARHPTARLESGSHYLVDEGILIDPIAPPEGLDWFEDREIGEILLTNRHHTRSAFELQERLNATIRAPRTGMHDLPVDRVQPYDFGDELSAGIRPHAISETWPDETALEIPGHRAVAIADGVINYDGLGFFADSLLGDDAEAEKERLRDGFARLAAEVDFDHLLLAHGRPIVGDGREQLRRFAAAG